MKALSEISAKRCLTACGLLIDESKVLLVLHKKLNLWLAPGGHVEENELPHKAAEREFAEETGLQVVSVSAIPLLKATQSENLPVPISINLHWISRKPSEKWPRGCEQHLVMNYLLKRRDKNQEFKFNAQETKNIGWFSLEEVKKLTTNEDIKTEIASAFKWWGK